jgi:hypothetical protein
MGNDSPLNISVSSKQQMKSVEKKDRKHTDNGNGEGDIEINESLELQVN